MKIPFNISPLNPDNVIDYYIRNEKGMEVAYITYSEIKAHVPTSWNIRQVLSAPDRPYRCNVCGHRDIISFSRCRMCSAVVETSTASAGTGQGKPDLKLAYFPKDNAKDKLVSIGGRACLVLGTVEAVFPDVSPENFQVLLLSFYYFHQTASAKYKVLQFCYYNPGTGQLFVEKDLKKLNDLLWKETTEHNFVIVPEWSVSKIYGIYMNRSV